MQPKLSIPTPQKDGAKMEDFGPKPKVTEGQSASPPAGDASQHGPESGVCAR